jgi:integrase
MARNPHGSIAISTQNERLRLQFPRSWYGGDQKYLSLKIPDTDDNRLAAGNIARQIERDYFDGKLKGNLEEYRPSHQPLITRLGLSELWREYCIYKSQSLKDASRHYLTNTLGVHIDRCPYQNFDRELEIRDWLLTATTPDMTRRIVQSLATATKWGIKHNRLTLPTNPFTGMAEDIRVEKEDPKPNALSLEEKRSVIDAFDRSVHYDFYSPLVRFLFLTGCRPSEAIGLQWEQSIENFSKIRFDRSITYIKGKISHNKKSKTNRSRLFPCNLELQALLTELHDRKQHRSLVFPSMSGQPIAYENFARRAWAKIADPILNRKSTPYSCRDTWFTEQIAAGKPIPLVAKWGDNSVEIIQKYYIDTSAIEHIRPL